MRKLSLVLAAAAFGAVVTAPVASADADQAVACTAAYVAALTDEYYLFYADYPYSWYAREQTVRYVACLR